MVLPKRPHKVASSPGDYKYIVLAVKILMVFLILLWLAPLVDARKRRKTSTMDMHAQRMECEDLCLVDFLPEESMNCILQCRSEACYAQIYGEMPLEPGEVDLVRAEQFDECNIIEVAKARRSAIVGKGRRPNPDIEQIL